MIEEHLLQTKTGAHWQRIGVRHHHGICLPLSAIKSASNCGIGDFADLLFLIDWCKSVGFDCIQLLPLNDTGDDSSPYNALSSCALDPVYIHLASLPDANWDPAPFAHFLPAKRIPYQAIKQQKRAWLRGYFERTFANVKDSAEYVSFLQQNRWLADYALFKACKEEEMGESWRDWPPAKQSPLTCKGDGRKMDFYCYQQFLAFSQMEKAKAYAEERGVLIKGDIPILLSPDSVDVWAHRALFSLDECAGAPPDFYNAKGQKWGFPLFNWPEMKKQNYAWWKMRLQIAEKLYHLYRIDHVVGFFRIWAIRGNDPATKGRFVPADEQLWKSHGRELLEMMIDSSSMLPLAEDLGTIPPVVYEVLHELGICGTKVMRWQRRWDQDRGYIDPKEYDPISMTTVSTPDSDTLQLWWKNYPDEARLWAEFKHWSYEPTLSLGARRLLLEDSHHSGSLFHINLLQEYLALFPALIHEKEEEERINIPGTTLATNWTYRFKPSLEEIRDHLALAETLRAII